MPTKRNRSEGWSHAKRTGHAYEQEFAGHLQDARHEISRQLIAMVSGETDRGLTIERADPTVGQILVPSIFPGGRPTNSKVDCIVWLSDGRQLNISIKKPSAETGQVHLVSLSSFLKSLRYHGAQYNEEIKYGLRCFTGETNGEDILQFSGVNQMGLTGGLHSKSGRKLEIYQNRLFPSTMATHMPSVWAALSKFLDQNLELITSLAFVKGHAKNQFADLLFYGCACRFIALPEFVRTASTSNIEISSRGSCINFPWGFLQVHRPGRTTGAFQLQFHHQYKRIEQLLN